MKVKLSMNFFSADGVMFEARDDQGTRIIHEWDDSVPLPTDTVVVNPDGSETLPVWRGRIPVDPTPAAPEPDTFSEITKTFVKDNPDPTVTIAQPPGAKK